VNYYLQGILCEEKEINDYETERKLCDSLVNEIEAYAYGTKHDLDDKQYQELITEEGKKRFLFS
jgi:hypothetical protein